jgi:hypothetical protein
MDLNNKQKWETFLSSIDTQTFQCLPTNKLAITTKRKTVGLATEFANKLFRNKGGTVELRATPEVLNLYRHLHVPDIPDVIIEDETLTHIVILASNISRVLHDVDIVFPIDHHNPTPSTIRADMDKSCSTWSISKIAEYFSFDDCVTRLEMPTSFPPYPENIYEMVLKDIRCRSEILRGIDLEEITFNSYSDFLRQMISITSIEAGSRLVLDALLVPLCSALGLQLEVEKNINYNFLPNCRFDYCIRKGEHIIGCVEAKSVKTLSASSIAQAVLQLMILQTLMQTETPNVEIPTFPFFAIVTDGYRFIYMQLKGSSLGFEHNEGKLLIREVRQESDFKDILQHIRFLVEGDQSEDDLIPQS